MTEYTTSSEAIREYMAARERTALWVNEHAPAGAAKAFVSPSYPPSIISDSDAPSYGPSDSDEESSHSLPPRMVLRYNDGRPDIPIAHDAPIPNAHPPLPRQTHGPDGLPSHPAQNPTQHSRSRSGSHALPIPNPQSHVPSRHAQSLSYATSHHTIIPQPHIPPSRSPESIVVLPSQQAEDSEPLAPPPTSISQNTSPHSQSSRLAPSGPRPLPSRSSIGTAPPRSREVDRSKPPQSPTRSQHNVLAPAPRHASNVVHTAHLVSPSPPIAHSHSQPVPPQVGGARYYGGSYHAPTSRAQSQLPYQYLPPAIVYAPSSKRSKLNYAPPAIVYTPSTHHPHNRAGAPSITFSHSVPVPPPAERAAYHPQAGPSMYPAGHGSSSHGASMVARQGSAGGSHSRSRERGRSLSRGTSAATGRTTSSGLVIIDHAPSPSGTPSLTSSECGSQTSGSTYYVLPSPGQKVQIIVSRFFRFHTTISPSAGHAFVTITLYGGYWQTHDFCALGNYLLCALAHELPFHLRQVPNSASLYTATSATKSAHSPQSPRKPFFQRIFHIPKIAGSADSRGSSGQGKRLQRRNTLGGAHLHDGRPFDVDQ